MTQTSSIEASIFNDDRGTLCAFEYADVPFIVKRMFVVSNVPAGNVRGKHAHYKTQQVLVCLAGTLQITFDSGCSGGTQSSIKLKQGESAYHGAMEWGEVQFIDPGSSLLSLCSTTFDPDDYIGNFVEFCKLKRAAVADSAVAEIPVAPIPIPMINLEASYVQLKSETDEAVHRVLDSCHYINGPDVSAFEEEFAVYTSTCHCVSVSSGTDALILALEALDIKPGDGVILQGNAYMADALAIDAVGGEMTLVDQDATFQLDLDLVEDAITWRTRAILVVHMYGSACCDMQRLMEIAARHELKVIEDCAHAHGAMFMGRMLGTWGDIGCFSFYPTKNLGAFGDGGACVTDDVKLDLALRQLKNYGALVKHEHTHRGRNHRLDSIQAAVLRVRLPHLDEWNARRRELAGQYIQTLSGVGDIDLDMHMHVICQPVYHQFVIVTSHRDALAARLKRAGIDTLIHYPTPIHLQQVFADDFVASSYSTRLPLSTTMATRILSLPMCPQMTNAAVEQVCSEIRAFFNDESSASLLLLEEATASSEASSKAPGPTLSVQEMRAAAECDADDLPPKPLQYDLRIAHDILSTHMDWLGKRATPTTMMIRPEFLDDAFATSYYLNLIRRDPHQLLDDSGSGRRVALGRRLAQLLFDAYGRGCVEIASDDDSGHIRFAVVVGRCLGLSDMDVLGQAFMCDDDDEDEEDDDNDNDNDEEECSDGSESKDPDDDDDDHLILVEESQVADDVLCGTGVTIVQPSNLYGCTLDNDVFVGPFCEVQRGVTIGERSRIQSHSFICTGVTLGQNCFVGHGAVFVNDLMHHKTVDNHNHELATHVGDNVIIGSNATILPVTICSDVLIGAGAVVTKSISEPGTYSGNPARKHA